MLASHCPGEPLSHTPSLNVDLDNGIPKLKGDHYLLLPQPKEPSLLTEHCGLNKTRVLEGQRSPRLFLDTVVARALGPLMALAVGL